MKLENDIAQHLEQGEFLALATIIDRSGSAPRHAGAQMLVTRDLSVIGTIGGGQVESDVLAACLPVRKGGTARLMHFDMTGFTPDADMICGGIVDILVERITPEQLPFFRQAAACRSRAAFGVWLVDITDPASPQRGSARPRSGASQEQQRGLHRSRRQARLCRASDPSGRRRTLRRRARFPCHGQAGP